MYFFFFKISKTWTVVVKSQCVVSWNDRVNKDNTISHNYNEYVITLVAENNWYTQSINS